VSDVYNRIAVFGAEQGISRRELAEAVRVKMLFSFDRFEPIAMALRCAGEGD
jgi:hypothetical protein